MTKVEVAAQRSFELLLADAITYLVGMNAGLETIWGLRPPKVEAGYHIISSGEQADAIRQFVAGFEALALTIFDKSDRRRSESRAVYEIRLKRLSIVHELFSGIDLTPFESRNIRNRFVHSDEYLAKELIRNPAAAILKDLGLSQRDAIRPKTGAIYIRVYEYETDTLLHLGGEFDAKRLYESGLQMAQRMR